MNRREMMMAVGAVAAVALPARAASPPAKGAPAGGATAMAGHEHHHGPSPLADAAGACVVTGTACLHHCIALLSGGDTSMAGCATAVSDMLAQARALLDLSLAQSKFVPAAARLMSDIAKVCQAECQKHAEMHAPCKACAESCAALIRESDKAAA